MALYFIKPGLDILEAFWITDIIDKENALCSFVIGGHNGFELLLTCGVPHLKFDYTSFLLYGSNFEIDSDGWEKGLMKDIISEAK